MIIKNKKNKEITTDEIIAKLNESLESLNSLDLFYLEKESEDSKLYLPAVVFAIDNNWDSGNEGIDISSYTVIDPVFYKVGKVLESYDSININRLNNNWYDFDRSKFNISLGDTVESITTDKLVNLLETHVDLFETQKNIFDATYQNISGNSLNEHQLNDLRTQDFDVLSKNLRLYVDTESSKKNWDEWKGKSFTFLADLAKLCDAIYAHESKISLDAPSPARELFDQKIAVLNSMYKND